MIAAEVSESNKNFVYGSVYDWDRRTDKYGWFCNYSTEGWSQNSDCCRDYSYTITPCCTITVEKKS